eukprot:m.359124 g.359124  ORF g.359124 m.359124 type:complete len:308 (-) comp16626_c5_seq2:6696-7619(-)
MSSSRSGTPLCGRRLINCVGAALDRSTSLRPPCGRAVRRRGKGGPTPSGLALVPRGALVERPVDRVQRMVGVARQLPDPLHKQLLPEPSVRRRRFGPGCGGVNRGHRRQRQRGAPRLGPIPPARPDDVILFGGGVGGEGVHPGGERGVAGAERLALRHGGAEFGPHRLDPLLEPRGLPRPRRRRVRRLPLGALGPTHRRREALDQGCLSGRPLAEFGLGGRHRLPRRGQVRGEKRCVGRRGLAVGPRRRRIPGGLGHLALERAEFRPKLLRGAFEADPLARPHRSAFDERRLVLEGQLLQRRGVLCR